MKQPIKILFVLFLFLLAPINAKASEVSVANPWIREAPPGTQMLAAYMRISNNSKHTIQLESAASDDFEMVAIHRTETHEGMSHMTKQSGLQIKSGENVMLEPGGYHLMLMKPKRNLQSGDNIKLQLQFDKGEVIDVTAVVRKQ
jgi:periplasmic copper chaperone A